jgi:hypothetical protein
MLKFIMRNTTIGLWMEGRILGKAEEEQQSSFPNEGKIGFQGLRVCWCKGCPAMICVINISED